jgi:hypothetical protein
MNQRHLELPELLATDIDCHFEQLILAYQHRLYAFALHQVGNSVELAGDL